MRGASTREGRLIRSIVMGNGANPAAKAGLRGSIPPFPGDERFELHAKLGAGGMGVVYEALDRERSAVVALKALPSLSGETLLRFKHEFRAVHDIKHPNLVELGELIERAGRWFITMELVHGVDLITWVRGARPSSSKVPAAHDADAPTRVLEQASIGTEAAPKRGVGSGSGEHVRVRAAPRGTFDELRLRSVLAQLCRGLLALHAANKVHRDVKPSNILVTAAGTVKLLDFGLVAEVGSSRSVNESGLVVGTPNYMAPEQATGATTGPEADWYSVGVALFVALTGGPPFLGDANDVMVAKQLEDAPRARTRCPDVPPDLDELCAALLARDVARRATGRDVLALLEGADFDDEMVPSSGGGATDEFVGRVDELARLRDAQREARLEPRTVLVTGESGVGKSALVARFVRDMRREDPTAVILHGRCYEREAVPYKAFDDVVDALSEHLAALPRAVQLELLPEDAGLVAHVFPVFAQIADVARRSQVSVGRVAPQLLRTRVFHALRVLLGRLAMRAPLTIVIDDLQWSDADSLALLREVQRPPGAPRLLLLATMRGGAETPVLAEHVRTIALGVLAPAEARLLVDRLVAGTVRSAPLSEDALVVESGGHPLFLTELVRHALSPASMRPEASAKSSARFEDALAARLRRLAPAELETLSLLALAGAPLTLTQAARACGVERAELADRLSTLRGGRLVQTSGPQATDHVEPYHDRIRTAVVAQLDPERRRALHRRLAIAIELDSPDDHETLARHWTGAGETSHAIDLTIRAAEASAAAFAFHTAAEMYRRALALLDASSPRASALQQELGRMLSWAGHGVDAAAAYREAARDATPGVSLELRRRAAEQLVSTGHLVEGEVLLREVLAEARLSWAGTTTGAVASLLLQRARVRLRGLAFVDREASTQNADALARIDVCWSAVVSLSMVDTVRGADYQARNLRLALDAGEPYRVCRALAWESAMESAIGDSPRAERLGKAAMQLASRLGSIQLRALVKACGATAAYLTGRWSEVRRLIGEVVTMSEQEWSDEARYELDNGTMLANAALAYMGNVVTFYRERPALLAEARERRNVHVLTNLLSGMNVIHLLARGQHAQVVAELDESIGYWSADRVHIPHFVDLYGRVQAALFVGDGERALALVDALAPRLGASFLLHGPYFRINVRDLAGRASLCAAAAASGKKRVALLRRAARDASALAKGPLSHWAGPLADAIAAGVAMLRDDRVTAEARLSLAAERFAAADMGLHAAAARRSLGRLRGDDSLVASATEWMRAQTVTHFDEVGAILVPGSARSP